MKTIIQDFPTIYGEIVNGSVYGQPNGSIARPPQNIPSSIVLSGNAKVTYTGVPQSGFCAYDLSDMLTTIVAPAGFNSLDVVVKNSSNATVGSATLSQHASTATIPIIGQAANKPTNGDALTVIITMNGDDGNPIATSNTLPATAVVS